MNSVIYVANEMYWRCYSALQTTDLTHNSLTVQYHISSSDIILRIMFLELLYVLVKTALLCRWLPEFKKIHDLPFYRPVRSCVQCIFPVLCLAASNMQCFSVMLVRAKAIQVLYFSLVFKNTFIITISEPYTEYFWLYFHFERTLGMYYTLLVWFLLSF